MIGSVCAVLFLVFLPLWFGKVGPNRFFGYRTLYSLSSEGRWYYMNRFAARLFLGFFSGLIPAEIFLNDKIMVWLFLGGVPVLMLLCFLEEKRQKWLDLRRHRARRTLN